MGTRCRDRERKGVGDTAIRNYEKWKDIRINMDTLCANKKVDTSLNIFGKSFRYPFFAGPVGAVNLHYGEKYNDASYNEVLVSACAKAGIAAMTGDGVNADVMKCATEAIKKSAGIGIPTVKPWNLETVKEKMRLSRRFRGICCCNGRGCGRTSIFEKYDSAGRKKIRGRVT